MALMYHPDKNLGDKNTENVFKEVNKAYEILSDKEKRAQYDIHLNQTTTQDFSANKYSKTTNSKETEMNFASQNKKIKNWFEQHPVISFYIAIIIIGGIANYNSDNSKKTVTAKTSNNAVDHVSVTIPDPAPKVDKENFQKSCGDNSYYSNSNCYCNDGYAFNAQGVCTSRDVLCKNNYGENSFSSGDYCYCSTGHHWNDGKTSCISNAFIIITQPEDPLQSYSSEPLYIKGNTSNNCSKIIAQSTNKDAGVNDTYVLKNYKYGDQSFSLKLQKNLNDLGEGINDYQFTIYCDDNQIIQASTKIQYNPPVSEKTISTIQRNETSTTTNSCGPNANVNILNRCECDHGYSLNYQTKQCEPLVCGPNANVNILNQCECDHGYNLNYQTKQCEPAHF